jgi:hypothetical protein
MGSLGVEPGPGYAKIDRRRASSMGVWLEVEMNRLVRMVSSIFSMPIRQYLSEATV